MSRLADKSREKVRAKYPQAVCLSGGRPSWQIWNTHGGWYGEKLGQGKTEVGAWKDAAKQLSKLAELLKEAEKTK